MKRPVIAVIGAGITGSLIAREIISREPNADVTVLDRDGVGAGATRRSAGLHFPRGSSARVRQMSAYSQDYYADLLRRDPSLPIYPLPMCVVLSPGAPADLLERYLKQATLTPVKGQIHPAVPTEGMRAWTGDGCQYADVYHLTQRIARVIRPQVAFHEGVTVTGLTSTPERVRVQLSTGAGLAADYAVLAPGPWVGSEPWRNLTAPLGIGIKRVVALHIEQAPREGEPCVVFEEEDAFLLPVTHRGHWLFSYTCPEWGVDPDATPLGLSASHVDQAQEVLGRFAPQLARQCSSGRVFCDAYSPDRQPVIRALDAPARIVFAGAANGSGYRLGPAIASATAELLGLPAAR